MCGGIFSYRIESGRMGFRVAKVEVVGKVLLFIQLLLRCLCSIGLRKMKLVYTSKFKNYKTSFGVSRKLVLASFVVHLFYTATIRMCDADQLL